MLKENSTGRGQLHYTKRLPRCIIIQESRITGIIFWRCESDIYSVGIGEPPPRPKVHLEFARSSDLHLNSLCLERVPLSLCAVCSGATGGYRAR